MLTFLSMYQETQEKFRELNKTSKELMALIGGSGMEHEGRQGSGHDTWHRLNFKLHLRYRRGRKARPRKNAAKLCPILTRSLPRTLAEIPVQQIGVPTTHRKWLVLSLKLSRCNSILQILRTHR